jgi:hypothetical protein
MTRLLDGVRAVNEASERATAGEERGAAPGAESPAATSDAGPR